MKRNTQKDCKTMGAVRHAPIKTICPWDKIPKEVIKNTGKEPIKERTKSFEGLKQLALDGISKYWSRHKGNIGKGVEIDGELYEVFVDAVNETDSNISLDDVPLIYNTNNPWSRSGNTGGSYKDGNLDDEVMRLLPNGLVQRISFNVGYIYYSDWKEYKGYAIYKNKGWSYYYEKDEIKDYKETSAHEIGHEILQAYAGTVYSWQHKGSSYYLPQDKKPVSKESFKEEYINVDFMEETSGENYPKGEIDLMKYYNGSKPSDYFKRIIANNKDVLSLIWLTKINTK